MYIYEPVFGECAIDGSWFSLAATKAQSVPGKLLDKQLLS